MATNRVLSQCGTVLRTTMLVPALAASAVLLARTSTPATPAFKANDRLWRRTHGTTELSVVIPFYNPGTVIVTTVTDIITALDHAHIDFEIIAVSDGSTDGSPALLHDIDPRVQVIEQPHNMGKGAALHTGFATANGTYLGMIDADGDIDPDHLVTYTRMAQTGSHDVVYADKRHTDSITHASRVRKLISWGFSTLVNMLFNLKVADTQTGCKVFHRDAMATVLPVLAEQRFAFDLEFFVAARDQGITNLQPAPVTLNPRTEGSTVTSTTILRTLRDAITVLGRHRLAGHYRTTTPQPTTPHLTLIPTTPATTNTPIPTTSYATAA